MCSLQQSTNWAPFFLQLHLLQVRLTTRNSISNEHLLNREFLQDQDQGIRIVHRTSVSRNRIMHMTPKTRPEWRVRFWTWTMWPEWTSTYQYTNPDGWCTDGFHFFIPMLTRLVSTGWFVFPLLTHDPPFFWFELLFPQPLPNCKFFPPPPT